MVGAWAKLVWNSAVVAAGAAAAQLGAADALGIIRWDAPSGATRDWTALLTWVAFFYAVAVVGGALVGRPAVRKGDRSDGVGARITASLAAVAGAAAVIGLAWLPAHGAHPPANVNPGLVVSLTAGAGVVVGLVLALTALSAPAVAVGLRITVSWLWLAAIGCAIAGLVTHQPYPAPRLGTIDAPSLITPSVWTETGTMIGIAALAAVMVASVARWGGAGRLAVALSGFGGPAVVAASYLIAGPGTGTDRAAQAEPYVAALIAAGAGLIVSVLIAMPGRRTPAPPPRPVRRFEDRQPLTGDVIAPQSPVPPPRPAWAGGAAQTSAAYTRAPGIGSDASPSDRGSGWDADTWPGTRTGGSSRHTDEREADPAVAAEWPGGMDRRGGAGRTGGTYRGGTYSEPTFDPSADTASTPVMGQPPDPHESWLRELGTGGRHAVEERQP